MFYLVTVKLQAVVSFIYYLLAGHSMIHLESEDISCNYKTVLYKFHKQSFVASSLLNF